MRSERDILTKINHPFIVSLYFAFQSESKVFLVMDFLSGGELFYHLKRRGIILEKEVLFYLAEMVVAIDFLHNIGESCLVVCDSDCVFALIKCVFSRWWWKVWNESHMWPFCSFRNVSLFLLYFLVIVNIYYWYSCRHHPPWPEAGEYSSAWWWTYLHNWFRTRWVMYVYFVCGELCLSTSYYFLLICELISSWSLKYIMCMYVSLTDSFNQLCFCCCFILFYSYFIFLCVSQPRRLETAISPERCVEPQSTWYVSMFWIMLSNWVAVSGSIDIFKYIIVVVSVECGREMELRCQQYFRYFDSGYHVCCFKSLFTLYNFAIVHSV